MTGKVFSFFYIMAKWVTNNSIIKRLRGGKGNSVGISLDNGMERTSRIIPDYLLAGRQYSRQGQIQRVRVK